jgi:hypothetical protein
MLNAGIDLTDWDLSQVVDISDDGTVITGRGINPAGGSEGWIAVIPEPQSLLLLLVGLPLLYIYIEASRT